MDAKHSSAVHPDQPPQYNESAEPGNPPVVIVQNAQVQQNLLGSKPTMATCPSCHAFRMTRIEHKSSSKTHLIAVILGVTTCCCCIPYFFDSCKNTEHLCQNCGAYLGTYTN